MSKTNKITKEVITITLGDVAENHAGMERIGNMSKEGDGFNLTDLQQIKANLEKIKCESEIVTLKSPHEAQRDAYVLIIRGGVNNILKQHSLFTSTDMFDEQKKLKFDKKALMRGKVVNKHARWNVCYDKRSRAPDYENGKGRIIGFSHVPILKIILDNLEKYFGTKAKDLKGEGNYYHDITKTGIGYHGDGERRKVIGIRLGESMPLYYQWYHKSETVGDRITINLNGGDIYVMSELAVGTNWKKSSLYTLRHATGCDKYTKT